jgi:Rrf2 family protein
MLSRSSEYAIRALSYMGARKERAFMLSREIAEELGMPPPFLAKVLQTLAGVGILESQRGRGGGFRLARDPEKLSLFEVVEPFDHLADRKICVLGQKTCSEETACPLHHAWKATRGMFLTALEGTTLAAVERMNVPGGFPWRAKPTPAAPPAGASRS